MSPSRDEDVCGSATLVLLRRAHHEHIAPSTASASPKPSPYTPLGADMTATSAQPVRAVPE